MIVLSEEGRLENAFEISRFQEHVDGWVPCVSDTMMQTQETKSVLSQARLQSGLSPFIRSSTRNVKSTLCGQGLMAPQGTSAAISLPASVGAGPAG